MTTAQPTPRQLQILSMSANGHSREEIGKELFVSIETVKADLRGLREMVHARNTAHVVCIGMVVGWLQVSDGEVHAALERELVAA